MKFLKLDKKKGSGGPAIKSRYAFLIYLDDIAYLPPTNDKGVRMEGDILLKENCTMMPLYLTSSSQEFSYDTLGDDDEKSYKVKFSGNHPGTELEALEFAKNMIEQPFLVLIPACIPADPWKLLGEITNPLIFTSSHKATKDSSRFTFNFEQRIGSEYIYFSYGGVEVPSSGDGVHPPSGGFDPTKWARIDASNIDEHVAAWREKLGINETPLPDAVLTIGAVTATTSSINIALYSGGFNSVRINNTVYSKNTPDAWTFPTVTGEEVFDIYALPDPQIFYLARNGEEIPEGALMVTTITISPSGVVIGEPTGSQYKQQADDNWRNVNIISNDGLYLPATTRPSSFHISFGEEITTPKILGLEVGAKVFAWPGKAFTVYTEKDTMLEAPEAFGATVLPFAAATSYLAKAGTYTRVQIKAGKLVVTTSSGGASFPSGANEGDVLSFEGGEEVWSGRLTDAENDISAEEYNRALEDFVLNGKITNLGIHQISITTTTSITTDTLGNAPLSSVADKSQHGRNVVIDNGVNAISITCNTTIPGFIASYTKLGSAAITFVAGAGATLVQVDGVSILSGAVGSTACLTRYGNTFYLQISNR
ncbi:hypothetical protein L0B70_00365 [Kaistella sp. 97-N-M2]|uniref:hypothetical protein n=1 Tax=Kaistella sp. 97-N-M2 TaxID=2908645 RepID=UPI001F201C6C|nr:hypothetical protein [Kaistella sp. 97-N-M2]UJF29881.1 hypothetical protein L0B70_00365 [Kaistella sp. 97-N-M2]